MKTRVHFIAACLLTAAAFPLVAHAADMSSGGSDRCSVDMALTPLQRRVLLRYDQGVDTLMHYLWITRSTRNLDRTETVQWAERYRKTHPKC
ncbi:MAG TPA: hypothetical protein VF169_12935 [Albitalea sp.]|uniref:hypothetical protein n=1 Tax=Piscinibacter sp. TaxID=1903157 RepID=UPI002ED08359